VIAVAITSHEQRAGFPLTLELSSKSLSKESWVKISPIRTFATKRLSSKIGKVLPEELEQDVEMLKV
jgi:mRNA interferase MazF